jgi:hypothetical protein
MHFTREQAALAEAKMCQADCLYDSERWNQLKTLWCPASIHVRIPGQGEKDSGRNVKTIPG